MIFEKLKTELDDTARLYSGADIPDHYTADQRGHSKGRIDAVLEAQSVEDISKTVKFCNNNGIAIAPYGGGTGLVGGHLPNDTRPTLSISLARMDTIDAPSQGNTRITVQAGAILSNVHDAARKHGQLFPLDMASHGSCTIGGNLSTNAGGISVIRYGMARENCLGVQAVLPDGTVYDNLAALKKDNTGYNLDQLLIGAEGTLGIITAATLRLVPAPTQHLTALFTVSSVNSALDLLKELHHQSGDTLSAFELISDTGFTFLEETGVSKPPAYFKEAPWSILIELSSHSDRNAQFEATEDLFASWFEAERIGDGIIAQSLQEREDIWAWRENLQEANKRVGSIISNDISLPAETIEEFVLKMPKRLEAIVPGVRINPFGHLGDGNLHYNVYPPEGKHSSQYMDHAGALREAIHKHVRELRGSISAEHGIGRLKASALITHGNPTKLAAMRAIKTALDPNNIMNPGAIFLDEGV